MGNHSRLEESSFQIQPPPPPNIKRHHQSTEVNTKYWKYSQPLAGTYYIFPLKTFSTFRTASTYTIACICVFMYTSIHQTYLHYCTVFAYTDVFNILHILETVLKKFMNPNFRLRLFILLNSVLINASSLKKYIFKVTPSHGYRYL